MRRRREDGAPTTVAAVAAESGTPVPLPAGPAFTGRAGEGGRGEGGKRDEGRGARRWDRSGEILPLGR